MVQGDAGHGVCRYPNQLVIIDVYVEKGKIGSS